MNLMAYKDCTKILDFKPSKNWSHDWPAFSWETLLISHFNQQNKMVLNFTKKDISFLSLFYSCYNKLNLLELENIFVKWNPKKDLNFLWKDFFTLYGFGQNTEAFIQELNLFISLPPEFKNWIHKKDVHLKQLRLLKSIKPISKLNFIFNWICQQNLSYSLGIKALELSAELFLMGVLPHKILTLNTSPEEAIQIMEQTRKPISASQEQKNQKNLNQIIGSSHIKAQWQRKGDNTGIEIKLWCKNQEQLEEQIKRIQNKKLFNPLKNI